MNLSSSFVFTIKTNVNVYKIVDKVYYVQINRCTFYHHVKVDANRANSAGFKI